MTRTPAKPILLVIGPHRSGTSVLTQILSTLGYDLGRTLMPPSYDNPRGFWENERIVEAHDKLLEAFGYDWTNAAFLPEDWLKSEAAQRVAKDIAHILDDDFNDEDPSLVKDPRLCILSPLWDGIAARLKRPLHKVMITREPDHIAASIARRDGISHNDSLAIALTYLDCAAALKWPNKAKALSYESLMNWEQDGALQSGLDLLSQSADHEFPRVDSNQAQQIFTLLRPVERERTRSTVANRYSKIIAASPNPLISDLQNFTTDMLAEPDFADAVGAMRAGKSLRPEQSPTVEIPRGTLGKLESDLDQAKADRDAFKDGVAEREKMLTSTRRKLSKAIRERDAFKDGIDEREASLRDVRSNLAKALKDKAAFEAGNAERDRWIDSLKSDLAERETELTTARLDIESKRVQIEKQREAMEAEAARARMVEAELTARIDRLTDRVTYFEGAPFRRGLKLSVFSLLRTIRRRFPLAEETKLKIARKFTPLALALKPHRDDQPGPVPRIETPHHPDIIDPSEDTSPASPEIIIDFAFRQTDEPIISIIVPVYNEISQTIACLRSIYQQQIDVDYEVILADDCSPEPSHELLKDVPGLRYFRNEENLHFLRNCNENARHARGDYLVFLNNDTLVRPGWLQALYDSFSSQANVGIVGSKLIFPDGTLQEAGGIIWEDGSGWNWGRGQNPKHPLYNFVRDVDYVSGASFMIPKAIWEEVGGFSDTLEKAYYEDTDLCFQLRERGYRVLYQPASELVHIEGLSSGTDLDAGVKQYQRVNQDRFKSRWAETLAHHWPNATRPLLASDRTRGGHILYIDAVTPEPNSDSGSLDALNAMRILQESGYRVHFIPGSNFTHWGAATQQLQQMGVECLYHPFYSNLEQVIADRGDMFDYVILSRPESADRFLNLVEKRLPSAKIIYNTVDLHFMRLERRAKEQSDPDILSEADAMKAKELDYIARSDATIVLSEVEHSLLSEQYGLADKLWIIPLIREETTRLTDFETTQDIAFIGGYRHPPNVDAVDWLVSKIWPQIETALPDVRLHICGSHMPEHFQDYASERVHVRGFIPDMNALLSGLRLTIAPLRFGAGLKGKVASSIGVGVPCVGTDIAFEGMASDGLDLIKLNANTPEEFASTIKAIYHDKTRWTAVSKAGVTYHNTHYAYQQVMTTYQEMLDTIRT